MEFDGLTWLKGAIFEIGGCGGVWGMGRCCSRLRQHKLLRGSPLVGDVDGEQEREVSLACQPS